MTTAATPGAYTFRWLLAWGVFLVILSLVNRTRVGHVTIYYLLVLALLLLLVTQFGWLSQVLQPVATLTLTPQQFGTAPGALESPQQVARNGG
jgi:hypothetical protein